MLGFEKIKEFLQYAAVIAFVYVLGYFQFGICWPLLGFAVIYKFQHSKLAARKRIAIGQELCRDERGFLRKHRLLPSWAIFPDIDRAEWLNKIVARLHPYLAEFLSNLLHQKIAPKLKNKISGFKFEQIVIGDLPLRVTGIKVYEEETIRLDEIIADASIEYFGDCCIKASVKGIHFGVKNIQLRTTVRLHVTPLIPRIPFFCGLSISCLDTPKIEFELTEFGNLLELPLIKDHMMNTVMEVLSDQLVSPNRIVIPLIKRDDEMQSIDTNDDGDDDGSPPQSPLDQLKYPLPKGVLRINVIGASNLPATDKNVFSKDSCDPYVVITINQSTVRTRCIEDTVNPEWKESFDIVLDQLSFAHQTAAVEIFDKDKGEDDRVASCLINLANVIQNGRLDSNIIPMADGKGGNCKLRLDIDWLAFADDPRKLSSFAASSTNQNDVDSRAPCAYLSVVVESASNLPLISKKNPSTFARVFLSSSSRSFSASEAIALPNQRRTKTAVESRRPIWSERFHLLSAAPHFQRLHVLIYETEEAAGKHDDAGELLGSLSIPLQQVLEAPRMRIHSRPFQMEMPQRETTAAQPITVHLALTLRALVEPSKKQQVNKNGTEMPDKTPTIIDTTMSTKSHKTRETKKSA